VIEHHVLAECDHQVLHPYDGHLGRVMHEATSRSRRRRRRTSHRGR
jgi:hypothetical protein